VLSQDLEKADPTVYEIIQKVRGLPFKADRVIEANKTLKTGKEQTKALHQPHSL